MRVMLIYSNRARTMEPAPPIGLSYVATATRAAGHEVRFVDLMVSADPEGEVRRSVEEFHPEVVGISVRNIDNVVAQRTAQHLVEVSAIIATVRKHTKAALVLGGPATSILKKEALERLDADFAIVGEGESSFPKLLSAMQNGREYGKIAGLCYREGEKIVSVAPERHERFGPSGMEQWIDWPAYERIGGTWPVHTKRGCPLGCLYCNYPVMEGHRLRQRSAAEVADEIEQVMEAVGPRTFEFTDSTFNVPESHALGICEEIIRRKLKVNLSAVGVNPLTVSENLFARMKEAGFHSLVITPDSASEKMLKNLRKGFTVDHVRRTARLAKESGIRCTWFFLLGGPGETNETVEETVSFVEQNLNSSRFLTILMTGIRILPGTDLAGQAMAEKYLPGDADLCDSFFYCSKEVDEGWVLQRINQAIARCPTVVHGAEQPQGSPFEKVFNRALYWLRVAPPYWRFLPTFLSIPPLPALRARRTDVSPGCGKGVAERNGIADKVAETGSVPGVA